MDHLLHRGANHPDFFHLRTCQWSQTGRGGSVCDMEVAITAVKRATEDDRISERVSVSVKRVGKELSVPEETRITLTFYNLRWELGCVPFQQLAWHGPLAAVLPRGSDAERRKRPCRVPCGVSPIEVELFA